MGRCTYVLQETGFGDLVRKKPNGVCCNRFNFTLRLTSASGRMYGWWLISDLYLKHRGGPLFSLYYRSLYKTDGYIHRSNSSLEYSNTMWTRTDDGIYDICQACNVKIKVRGSKNIYPMKRHLATRRHKAREIAVEEDGKENILEKPVFATP